MRFLRAIPSAVALFVAVCLAIFGVPVTAAACTCFAFLAGPWARWRVGRGLALVAGLGVAVAGWWVPLHEYQDRVDALSAQIARGGPAALSRRDLAGIWVLNVGMAAGGCAVGFPEAALETLLLAVPGPEVRRFRSDFAMGSALVRDAAAAIARDGRPRRIVFRYGPTHAEARVGLALNALALSGARSGDALELVGRVNISYPPQSTLPLFTARGREITIEEGLYHAAQERGWLHPYVAEWRWTVAGPPRES